jgi:hypothetical protein
MPWSALLACGLPLAQLHRQEVTYFINAVGK